VKVLDFGLAKAVAATAPRSDAADGDGGRHARRASFSARAAYMSPEQARGSRSTGAPTSGRLVRAVRNADWARGVFWRYAVRHDCVRARARTRLAGAGGGNAYECSTSAAAVPRQGSKTSPQGHWRCPSRAGAARRHRRRTQGTASTKNTAAGR
jgi:hypothetical protein